MPELSAEIKILRFLRIFLHGIRMGITKQTSLKQEKNIFK